MLDEKKLRKKVLLGMLAHPATYGPFVLGTTLLAGALAFGGDVGLLAFSGGACVLGAIGVFFTRLLLGSEQATQQALEELREENDRSQERRLDELEKKLAADEDPRTEAALQDLRAFEEVFRDRRTWASKLNAASAFEIVAGVQDLFEGSVNSLEASLGLWKTANRLRTPEARKPILVRRDEIIHDVQASIKQLSRIMVDIQCLGTDEQSDSELSRIRKELDENLAVARRVEEKMRSWQDQSFDLE